MDYSPSPKRPVSGEQPLLGLPGSGQMNRRTIESGKSQGQSIPAPGHKGRGKAVPPPTSGGTSGVFLSYIRPLLWASVGGVIFLLLVAYIRPRTSQGQLAVDKMEAPTRKGLQVWLFQDRSAGAVFGKDLEIENPDDSESEKKNANVSALTLKADAVDVKSGGIEDGSNAGSAIKAEKVETRGVFTRAPIERPVEELVSIIKDVTTKAKKHKKYVGTELSEDCDLYSGQWVMDRSRPLYRGNRCSWLASNWACRKSKRPSFEYEKYRWQPDTCDLPKFDAVDFLERMRGKRVLFIGDSLGQQHYQSLLCLLSSVDHSTTEERPVLDVGSAEYGFRRLPGARRPTGWAHRYTEYNLTVVFYWTTCLCQIVPYDKQNATAGQAMHVDRPDTFLRKNLRKMDLIIMNTGHHWNRVKMAKFGLEFYVNGTKSVPVKRKAMTTSQALNILVNSLSRWIDRKLRAKGKPGPMVFLTTLSPRHFMGGEWNTGGACDHIQSILTEEDLKDRKVRDMPAEMAVNGTAVRLLNITGLSSFRGDAHPSKWDFRGVMRGQDCLHWCLPGVPDLWNELVYAHILLKDKRPNKEPSRLHLRLL